MAEAVVSRLLPRASDSFASNLTGSCRSADTSSAAADWSTKNSPFPSGWAWGAPVVAALRQGPVRDGYGSSGLAVWSRIPEWEDQAPPGEAASKAIDPEDVRVRLKGDLRDFPFIDPAKGQFLVAAHVQHGALNYAAGWPRITRARIACATRPWRASASGVTTRRDWRRRG